MSNPTQRIAVAMAAGVLACAGCAHAAPGESRFPISIAEVEARAAERWAAMDTDASGTVDAAEFAEAPRAQRGEHAGKRGTPGGWKHRKGMQRLGEGPRAQQREALKEAAKAELFTLLDSNGDGTLSAEEHAAATKEMKHTARRTARFKHLDANDDALLTQDEMPSPAERLRAADADGDGQVTRREMRAAFRARQQAG